MKKNKFPAGKFILIGIITLLVILIFGFLFFYTSLPTAVPPQSEISTRNAQDFGTARAVRDTYEAILASLSTPTPVQTRETTSTKLPTMTAVIPDSTMALQSAFAQVDKQFEDVLKGNIAFNKPSQMRINETVSVQLILNPSVPESTLVSQIATQNGLVTSTANPGDFINPNGEKVSVGSGKIDITQRMRAVLLSPDPQAFVINQTNDNEEQAVGLTSTTTWRWFVTAKKKGPQTLNLIIYQLVNVDKKDFWHEVQTYQADIKVEVTAADWLESLDWKWFAGFILACISAALGISSWLSNRKKKTVRSSRKR